MTNPDRREAQPRGCVIGNLEGRAVDQSMLREVSSDSSLTRMGTLSRPSDSQATVPSEFDEAMEGRGSPGLESRTSASGWSESESDWDCRREAATAAAEAAVPWLLANLQQGGRAHN